MNMIVVKWVVLIAEYVISWTQDVFILLPGTFYVKLTLLPPSRPLAIFVHGIKPYSPLFALNQSPFCVVSTFILHFNKHIPFACPKNDVQWKFGTI